MYVVRLGAAEEGRTGSVAERRTFSLAKKRSGQAAEFLGISSQTAQANGKNPRNLFAKYPEFAAISQ